MADVTAAAGGAAADGEPVLVMDLSALALYIAKVGPPLLDVSDDMMVEALALPAAQKAMQQFISDARHSVLVISLLTTATDDGGAAARTASSGAAAAADASSSGAPRTLDFALEVVFRPGRTVAAVAFIKRTNNSLLEARRSPASQLQVINLGNDSPFDLLHSYLQNSLAPFVRSFTRAQQEELGTRDHSGAYRSLAHLSPERARSLSLSLSLSLAYNLC